jgi:small subunit ribosomal protein S20
MANIKSAKKRAEQALVRTARNTSRKSRVRTFVRKLQDAIKAGNKELALTALRDAQSELMQGVTKGVMTLNTASRRVSRFTQAVKKLS